MAYFWTLLTQIQLKLTKIENQQEAKSGQESPQLSHFTDGKTEATGQSNQPVGSHTEVSCTFNVYITM